MMDHSLHWWPPMKRASEDSCSCVVPSHTESEFDNDLLWQMRH